MRGILRLRGVRGMRRGIVRGKTAQQTQQCGQKDCAGAAKQKQKKPECNAQSFDKLSKNKHNRQGGKLKNVERDTLH